MPIIATVSRCIIALVHKSESESSLLSINLVSIALKRSQTVMHITWTGYHIKKLPFRYQMTDSLWIRMRRGTSAHKTPVILILVSHGCNFVTESETGRFANLKLGDPRVGVWRYFLPNISLIMKYVNRGQLKIISIGTKSGRGVRDKTSFVPEG